MRTGLAIATAYAATIAAVPLLFVAAALVTEMKMPMPRGMMFPSVFELYLFLALLAFVSGLPGFLLMRFVLWRLRLLSPLGFGLVGMVVGFVAAAILCFPGHLWVLRRYNLDGVAGGVGAASGILYWLIEHALFRPTVTHKVSSIGENGS